MTSFKEFTRAEVAKLSEVLGKEWVYKFIEIYDSITSTVDTASTQTVTNKTITSSTINTSAITLSGATDALGSTAITANAGSQADPAALTSTDVATADANAVYGAEERDLINELKADFNLLRADVAVIRTALIGAIDYCDSLKTTLNALLSELRKTNGCGVLKD